MDLYLFNLSSLHTTNTRDPFFPLSVVLDLDLIWICSGSDLDLYRAILEATRSFTLRALRVTRHSSFATRHPSPHVHL